MSKSIADLQSALDAQAVSITRVEAGVADLEARATEPPAPVDLSAQVEQLEAQTAKLDALFPAAPAA